jgi:transcriptional regulator with XRE-family HTH domain
MPSGTPSIPATALGARIRALREEKEMKQWQLAYVVGTLQNRVSDWEMGLRQPTLPSLEKLAAAFGITVSDLLDGVM